MNETISQQYFLIETQVQRVNNKNSGSKPLPVESACQDLKTREGINRNSRSPLTKTITKRLRIVKQPQVSNQM